MVWEAYIKYGSLDVLNFFSVRNLLLIVRDFENKGWIKGFNYNIYGPEDEDYRLSIRLDLNEEFKQDIEKVLNRYQIESNPDKYTESDKIARFYELGSRLAFLLVDLINKGRFPKDCVKDDDFWRSIHGLCNSLLIDAEDEINIHQKCIDNLRPHPR